VGNVYAAGHSEIIDSYVGSFIANLPEMLGAMAADPRCFASIIEFSDCRYVQFWVEPDGLIIAEVVSNRNIGSAVALSADDEAQLRNAGWSEPTSGPTPNWRFEARGMLGLGRIVAMTRDAVYDVLREGDSNPVSVRSWEVPGHNCSSEETRERARVHYQATLADIERRLDEE
jgi:type III secretion system-like peptide-binding chaperone